MTPPPEDGGRAESVLKLKEIQEELHTQLLAVHEQLRQSDMGRRDQQTFLRNWVTNLRETVQPIINPVINGAVQPQEPWEQPDPMSLETVDTA